MSFAKSPEAWVLRLLHLCRYGAHPENNNFRGPLGENPLPIVGALWGCGKTFVRY